MKYNTEDVMFAIGQRIKKRRATLGISQGKLAEKLDCSPKTIINYESGQGIPLEKLLKICEKLDCDMGHILGEYDEPTKQQSDIYDETGLSAKAISVLQREKQHLDFIKKWHESRGNLLPKGAFKSMIIEIVNSILMNKRDVLDAIEELENIKWGIRNLESFENYMLIERAYEEAREEVLGGHSDGGVFEEAERKAIFLNKLDEYGINSEQCSYDGVYEILCSRVEIEKCELVIGLKFQKIINEIIEEQLNR